jgi:hypothetical protein
MSTAQLQFVKRFTMVRAPEERCSLFGIVRLYDRPCPPDLAVSDYDGLIDLL